MHDQLINIVIYSSSLIETTKKQLFLNLKLDRIWHMFVHCAAISLEDQYMQTNHIISVYASYMYNY